MAATEAAKFSQKQTVLLLHFISTFRIASDQVGIVSQKIISAVTKCPLIGNVGPCSFPEKFERCTKWRVARYVHLIIVLSSRTCTGKVTLNVFYSSPVSRLNLSNDVTDLSLMPSIVRRIKNYFQKFLRRQKRNSWIEQILLIRKSIKA